MSGKKIAVVALVVALLGSGLAIWALTRGVQTSQQPSSSAPTAEGIQGEVGPEGKRGLQGSEGVPGAKGTDGSAGSQGSAGAKGATGQAGAQGVAGSTGATGPQGASVQSTCQNGSECVSLQGSSQEVQSGNIAVSGSVAAASITTNKVSERPHKLLIYYGTPQGVNGVFNNDYSAQLFSRWDYVVFGGGLEDPGHTYHTSTQDIIGKIHGLNPSEKIFGYIDLGVSTNNYSIATMKTKVDQWKAMGADHIFLDDAGYDYQTSRARLNEMLDYIHAHGMQAMVNAWVAADVLGNAVNATYNPTGAATKMNSGDYYLLESWVVNTEAYNTHQGYAIMSDIKTRADAAASYRDSLGVKIVTTNTVDYSSHTDEQIQKYFQMVQAASSMYSLDAYGVDALHYGSIAPNANVVKTFEFDPSYPTYFSSDTPYTINGSWTEMTRPDTGQVFHNDFSTDTYWYRNAQTNLLNVLTVDTYRNNVGIGTTTPAARLHVQTGAIDVPTLLVKGVSGQTADVLQVQDSSGATLVKVDAAGRLTLNNNARAINAAITNGQTTLAVTFSSAYPNANYGVLCTPNYATTCYVTNQTANGFTLNFGTAAGAGATVSWMAVQ